MSEYQYYEFLAIDRPLATEEMDALRDLSSRARITPVSFSNEYNWGSFKGNPRELMRRFFDAHVYVANWGTAVFMVRLPLETLSPEIVQAMAVKQVLEFEATATHWLITWALDETEDYDRFATDFPKAWRPSGKRWSGDQAWPMTKPAALLSIWPRPIRSMRIAGTFSGNSADS